MKNKIEIQILSPATREQLIELRNEIRKIDGLGAFDLQLPATPLIQGKMDGGMALIVLEAVIAGVTHFTAEKTMEHYHEKIAALFSRILGTERTGQKSGVEAMSGALPAVSDKWKVAVSENKNGAKSVTCYDETGTVNIFSNREYSIDPEHTYAVLIGVSDYDDSSNFSRIPPVAGNLDEMYSIFSDRRLVGLPFENITRLYNENCIQIKDELRKVSRIKDIKTLIIYYSGHGQNTGNNQLSLIAKDTRNIDEELHNDIPYSFIEKMMNSSPADQKIIFIDACHSGLAAQGNNSNIFDFEPVIGTFTLASTSAEESSYFKKDAANTYFTSYLSDAFKEGISNSSMMLSLTDLYNYTSEKLLKNRLPAPVNKAQLKNIRADNFYISGNPAFSLEARLNTPKLLYQQGRYEEARREYILLEKDYPDNQVLRNEHVEFERNAEFNKLVKEGDILFFREKNYAAAQRKYREALTLKHDESIRDKIADCTINLQTQPGDDNKTGRINEQLIQGNGNVFLQQKPEQVTPGPTPIKNDLVRKRNTLLIRIGAIAVIAIILLFISRYHSTQTMKDNDGSFYSYKGETKNDKPEGEGHAKYKNGNEYEGEWTNGMQDGFGTYTHVNGDVYKGYFKNNYFNGKGMMKYQSGSVYDGNWSYGNFQGRGTYHYKNGDVYEGNWSGNKQNGSGLYTWVSGDTYDGNFKEDYRDGHGTYISTGGDIFDCPGCRKYTGLWKMGLKEGFGTCFDINGKLIYEGDFKA
ncbi:MAG: caspase family protein, partial [Bacteroidota bacterium]